MTYMAHLWPVPCLPIGSAVGDVLHVANMSTTRSCKHIQSSIMPCQCHN
jgi:hypothetical protein